MKSSIGRFFTHLFANEYCACCKQSSDVLLCDYCFADLRLFDLQQCDFNLLRIAKIKNALKVCSFERLVSSGEYQWPLSWLISTLKFSAKQTHAKALAIMFCRHSLPTTELPQLIIPVPLHRKRLASRLFNQAHLIASEIGKIADISVESDLVSRNVFTAPQTTLGGKQRQLNTQGAFSLNKSVSVNHVAIFDDVVTTGATVNALYELLTTHHPHLRVDVWSICITPERR